LPKRIATNSDLFKLISPANLLNIFGVDPNKFSASHPYKALNYVNGKWKESQHYRTIIDPLNGDPFI
jgi:1-pyrroline-5-carboxylate dehydrogenase